MRTSTLCLLSLLVPSMLLSGTADARGKKAKSDLNLIRDEDNYSRHFDDEVAADKAREDGAAAPSRSKKKKSSSKRTRKSKASAPAPTVEAAPSRSNVEDMKL